MLQKWFPPHFPSYLKKEEGGEEEKEEEVRGGGETKQFNGRYLDCIGFFNEISTIFLKELLNIISI